MTDLDGQTYELICAWLERALRGHEVLPLVVPGESPADAILRHERALATMTRRDLCEACRALVRRFVRAREGDDDYVAALLRLARGLDVAGLANDLHALASAQEPFSALPPAQQKMVISTLLDLRFRLEPSFWQELVRRDPRRFGVNAFSGLLRHGHRDALNILPLLPDEQAIADQIYVLLGQHAHQLQRLDRPGLDGLVAAVRTSVRAYPSPGGAALEPKVRAALEEWIQEEVPPAHAQAASRPYPVLERALLASASDMSENCTFAPVSPRLGSIPRKARG